MLVFTKKYKPLVVKLMFRLMLISAVMVLVVPYAIDMLNYRLPAMPSVITYYVSAVVIALGALSYVVAVVGILWAILEVRK